MKKKILIIEDDLDIRELIEILLRQEGYDTIAAKSGEILKEVTAIRPDLILLDNRLIEGFGKDFCLALKHNPQTSHFKVVLMSAAHDLASIAEATSADGFLPKPFNIDKFKSLVAKFMSD